MSNLNSLDSARGKRRIRWMKEKPNQQYVTCKVCGSRLKVLDEKNVNIGFDVTANIYKGVSRLSVSHTCKDCVRKAERAKKKLKKGSYKRDLYKILSTAEEKIEKAWMCTKCDKINSGKNKVCNRCNSNRFRWNGNKSELTPKKYFNKG